MSGQKKRKQMVACSGKLLVGCLEVGTAAFLCNNCKQGVKLVEYNKCRFSKYFVFEDETTKTICSNPEVRFQKFKFVYGKYHLFCFDTYESARSAQAQLCPDMHEVHEIVPMDVSEKEWQNEMIPFQYSGKHHKLLPRALPKPPEGAPDPLELLERKRNSRRSSLNSRSSVGEYDEEKDMDDCDLDDDPTLMVRRGLEKATRGIEEATTNLMRLKRTRTLSQTDSEAPGTPPQDEGSMSPVHMQDTTPNSPPTQLAHLRLPPTVVVPNGPLGWDSNALNFEQPAMQVGRLPVGKLNHHTPFQGSYVQKHEKKLFKEETPEGGLVAYAPKMKQMVFKTEGEPGHPQRAFDHQSSSDPMAYQGYEEGEVPAAMQYAFRASLTPSEGTPSEGHSDIEDAEDSESDTDIEREDEAIKNTDDQIQQLEAQIELLKIQKQAQLEIQRDRLLVSVLKQDRGRGRRKASLTGSPRDSSPRASPRTQRTTRSRRHRRSHSHNRTPSRRESAGAGRNSRPRRTHSVDFVNNTQILNRGNAKAESPRAKHSKAESPRAKRRLSGNGLVQAKDPVAARKKEVNLKSIFNSMNKLEWLSKGKHEYLKWRVDYCPRCAQVLDKAGKICIHCSQNNKCCIEDKNNCTQDESVVKYVDKFPAKLRKKIAKKFEQYIQTYKD